ncbi:hypothetical protein [Bernardetia sp. MNP-M8]|uniref:hypothetical protein n=1 Tax=Bernardetia sp. MNP-M8 TaxID=3127470 RepID=UPI0030D30B0F
MYTTIKYFILTFLSYVISNFAFSQAGVYKTHEDYLNNNLTDYGIYSSVYHILGHFTVTFEDENGKKTEIKIRKGNIWGYINNDGDVYRVNDKDDPCKIITIGKIVVYGNYTKAGYTTTTVTDSRTGFPSTRTSASFYSFGTNEEMKFLSKKTLKKELKKNKDKESLNMLKKVGVFKGYSLMEFINDYNRKFGQEDPNKFKIFLFDDFINR